MFFYGNRYFFIFAEKPVILKMKTTIIFLILSLMFPCFSFASDTKTIVEVLNELDEVIEKKHIYDVKKEESIAALKSRLSKGGDERVRYELNDSLFVAYLHYQADSAMYYVNKKVELLSFIDELEYAHEVIINKAEIMGIMGLYSEAIQLLDTVNPDCLDSDILGYYYRTKRACYGWWADYVVYDDLKKDYLNYTNIGVISKF